jgi:hypothetical protein
MLPTPTVSPRVSDLESLEEVTELAAPVAVAAERLQLVTEAAEAQKAQAVGELRQALMRLGCDAALDACHRDGLARVLYWRHTDIPVRDIAAALGFADQRALLAAAGPVDTGMTCKRCTTPLLATSRSRLAELQKLGASPRRRYGRPQTCDACRDVQASAEAAAWAAASALATGEQPSHHWPRPSDDDYGDFEPAAWVSEPNEQVGVDLDDAERLARVVADLAVADEVGATQVVQAAGFDGTASTLVERLADAVARARPLRVVPPSRSA